MRKGVRLALLSLHTCPLAQPGAGEAGGMNVYLRSLVQELARRGVAVDIFTRRHLPREPRVVPLAEGVRLVHLDGAPPEVPTPALPAFREALTRSLEEWARQVGARYALLHSHYWLSGLVGQALAPRWGVPHLLTFHTLAEVKAQAGAPPDPERAEAEKALARSADILLVFDEHEKEALVHLAGVPAEKVAVLPPGVDPSLFHPQDRRKARQALGLGDRRVVLFVGRLEPLKGLDLLLEGVARLEERDGLLALVVGGERWQGERERLEERARSLGLDGAARFEGPVPRFRLPLYYSAADVLVLPSRYESFSLAALEAMACGTPVIAPRRGGLPRLVRDGETGSLLPERCPEALAVRLEALLDHRPLREALGERACVWALRFSWERVGEKVVSLYEKALAGAPGVDEG